MILKRHHKRKNILLIEPGYESHYPPLGLMKISTWHKNKGDVVDFIKDNNNNHDFFGSNQVKLKKNYDKIYITTLFTYHAITVIESIKHFQSQYPHAEIKVGGIFATLLPNVIKEQTGINPHLGLLDGAEHVAPDYSLFPKLRCSITFTSRGCKRKCMFCAVRCHEPQFFIKEDWEKDIDISKERIIFWDNNWLFSPRFVTDVENLKRLNKIFDFNQGLDCRLFDKEKAKLLSTVRIKPLRFAFDNHSEEGYIQSAIKTAEKIGFNDIRVYVLYNSEDPNDTPDYFFYRINELNKLGVLSYPMRYRSINSIENHFVSPRWEKPILRAVKLCLMFFYSYGMIRRNREAFTALFGKNAKEFKEKMCKIYESDKKKKKKNK